MSQDLKHSELHEICAGGDEDLLQEILSFGRHDFIDYKDPDWGERAPIHWCCIKGKGEMARKLLDKGAHPGVRSSSGWTPAHYAAEGGRTHILRILHSYKAPMDRRDLFGDTPKKIAEIYAHKDSVEFLKIAEQEYRDQRRKVELSGDAELYDDEDVEWCHRNNIKPEAFITDLEMAEIASTMTSLSSVTPSVKARPKGRHYPKQGSRRGGSPAGNSRVSTPKRGTRKSSKQSSRNS